MYVCYSDVLGLIAIGPTRIGPGSLAVRCATAVISPALLQTD
ncbi:hypothetical Protein YC6258_04264 [Gynuella sunshinyii YC6258]|uniref:Uncharacterized protein n=1 Tax=Gynuella sunshinyii YC6258 TaxID=1445510 RepID=A0A0C5VSK0_9GAMM|nr:hypothetical Protein YC6258_04264 [Gynuella sunshinyii YC6258]